MRGTRQALLMLVLVTCGSKLGERRGARGGGPGSGGRPGDLGEAGWGARMSRREGRRCLRGRRA